MQNLGKNESRSEIAKGEHPGTEGKQLDRSHQTIGTNDPRTARNIGKEP